MTNLVGTQIRDYQLTERVGSGGFGVVYRATQANIERDVAIKAILPEFAKNPKFIQRFDIEARIVARLEHPHIVPLYEYWQEKSGAFLVMRYIPGGSLRKFIDLGPMDLEVVSKVLAQVVSALTTAHQMGIVHRDVKPENILLDSSGNAYLVDFGIAKELGGEAITRTGELIGSAEYISPEQCRAEQVSSQSDIYSLGVMLFELLTGEHPFPGLTPVQLLHKHVNEPIPNLEILRPDLPSGLNEVIQRATAKDLDKRYANVDLLKMGVDEAVGVEVIKQNASAHRLLAIRQTNLPNPPTPFVSRQDEVMVIRNTLGEANCRLLTLTGPGGIGKTRLAIEVARQSAGSFDRGTHFVDLAVLDDPLHVASAVAETLGLQIQHAGSPESQVIDYLLDKQLLLVLDNFEHVLDAAEFVTRLLDKAPSLKLLVTSRQRLGLDQEWVHIVPAMHAKLASQAPHGESATQLFIESAQRAGANSESLTSQFAEIQQICELVGGMPLGVELAAAMAPYLACKEIAAEIENGIDFLQTTLKGVPERHGSIRAVFSHSWVLLSGAEQDAFARLSVFKGSFDRLAAEQIADASIGMLRSLAEKSLLALGGSGRYRIHELLRDFAEEKLVDAGDVESQRNHHLEYFANLALEAEKFLFAKDQLVWLRRLDLEIGNLRQALSWSLSSKHEVGVALASALGPYFSIRGRVAEGADWLAKLLGDGKEIHGTQQWAVAAFNLALLLEDRDPEMSEGLLTEAHEYFHSHGLKSWESDTLRLLSYAPQKIAGFEKAIAFAEQALSIAQEQTDQKPLARAHYRMGQLVGLSGEAMEKSRAHHAECVRISRKVGDRTGIVIGSQQLGSIAIREGDVGSAETLARECLVLSKDLRMTRWVSASLTDLAEVAWAKGDFVQAKELCERGLEMDREWGFREFEMWALAELAVILAYKGDSDLAKLAIARSLEIHKELGLEWAIAFIYEYAGRVSWTVGDLRQAKSSYDKSMNDRIGRGDQYGMGRLLEYYAWYAFEMKDFHQAAILLGSASASRDEQDVALVPTERIDHEKIDRILKAELQISGFNKAFEKGEQMALEAATAVAKNLT